MGESSPERGRVDCVVADFCEAVISEPLCFFSEADLQGFLFMRLIEAFPDQVKTSYGRGPGSKGMYQTGIVHREYGAGNGQRIDISVFSPKDVTAIDNPNLTIGGDYIIPRFAIELGTEKTTDTQQHIVNDLDKLSQATDQGYLIHFYRDVTRADAGTKARSRSEDKIQRIFRTAVSEARQRKNVSFLCFVVRIAHSHRNIRGKCEMFDVSKGKWRTVNLALVRDDVLKALKEVRAN